MRSRIELNRPYYDKGGHRERGILHKALNKIREQALSRGEIPISKGQVWIERRFMRRPTKSGRK